MGAFCGVVARHKGKIIGYWVGFIRPHFHYADSLTAYTDIYFVDKAYRKSGVGADLFKHVEKVLKQRGVQKIFTATKLHLNHSALFKAAGYHETEIVFTKLLGD
jgi:N-acetylglutamate synthase-like GNAT family acetyltransferase